MFNQLKGTTLEQISHYRDKYPGDIQLESLKELLDLLRQHYNNSNCVRTVERENKSIRQCNQLVTTYMIFFQRIIGDIQ